VETQKKNAAGSGGPGEDPTATWPCFEILTPVELPTGVMGGEADKELHEQ